MKLSKYVMLALAGLAFAACSNEDAEQNSLSNGKSVSISIANMAKPDSRATGSFSDEIQKIPVADISNLKVIFLAGDQISSTTTFDKGTNVDGIYTFHKVPGDVNAVAILGNTDKVITVHSSFSTLLDAIKKDLIGQQSTPNDIVVYGKSTSWSASGSCSDESGATSTLYDAGQITVQPLLARIEIGGIACTDLGESSASEVALYKELTLSKIGIDNILTAVDGSETISYPATEQGQKDWNAATGWYIDPFNPEIELKDKDALPNVYVYNVAPGAAPRIILTVANGVFNNGVSGNLDMPQYVRASSYTDDKGTEITAFEAGKIYKVNYAFTCNNIKPRIPVETICVKVDIVIPNWTIVNLTPDFD